MADQYNSAHTGAEIDQAVSDVQNNKDAWSSKPQPSDTIPKAPGTASAGTESAYARGDHVHPNEVAIFEASTSFDVENTNVGSHELTYDFTYDDVVAAVSRCKTVLLRITGQWQKNVTLTLTENASYAKSKFMFVLYHSSGAFFGVPVINGSAFMLYIENHFEAKLNRTTKVNAADTNYTTYMARGEALFSTETTPTVNGCIAWQYG